MPTTYCRRCPYCGKAFETPERRKLYCSADCRRQEERKKKMESQRRRKRQRAEAKCSLERDVAEAERLGMSYGQYKAWCILGERRKK